MNRLEPVRKNNLWAVALVNGSRKKGTRTEQLVSEYAYTLAQAQAFISNNRVSAFAKGV